MVNCGQSQLFAFISVHKQLDKIWAAMVSIAIGNRLT